MAGISWPTLTAGAIARASDVNSHFAWLEGHLVPMSGGATTDLVYDLGTTTARWNFGYIDKVMCHNLNPTTTAKCIVVGTTTAATTTADSDATMEFAGARAILLPRLSTTQIGNLTSSDGLFAYNTTTAQVQVRKNGAWVNVGGPVYFNQGTVVVTANAASSVTALNITGGGGKIFGIIFKGNAANTKLGDIAFTLDGHTIINTTSASNTNATMNFVINGAGALQGFTPTGPDTTTISQIFYNQSAITPGIFDFASTATLYFGSSGNTVTAIIAYATIQ